MRIVALRPIRTIIFSIPLPGFWNLMVHENGFGYVHSLPRPFINQ